MKESEEKVKFNIINQKKSIKNKNQTWLRDAELSLLLTR